MGLPQPSTPSVLYLTRNGLLEPLGQSQILPYLRCLSSEYRITLITFEKHQDHSNPQAMASMQAVCKSHGIRWIPLRFRAHPRPFAAFLSIPTLAAVALWQWRLPHPPQLVHVRSYLPAGVALLLHWLTGVPFIFDMRALWPEELISAGHLRRGSSLHRCIVWLERRCLIEAASVVSLTQAAVDHLQRELPSQLEEKPFAVIPTCADLERFTPATVSGPDTQLVIGCIGTVLSGWFLIDWLRAFLEAVHRAAPEARFEIISRDPPASITAALALPASLQSRLLLASATPQQMPDLIRRHSASVMFFTPGLSKLGSSPTRMAEVLGCGRPVVVNSGVGDLDAILSTHRVGVLAQQPDASSMDRCVHDLLHLLRDHNLAGRCRATAERLFSLPGGSQAYAQLYRASLAGPRRR